MSDLFPSQLITHRLGLNMTVVALDVQAPGDPQETAQRGQVLSNHFSETTSAFWMGQKTDNSRPDPDMRSIQTKRRVGYVARDSNGKLQVRIG